MKRALLVLAAVLACVLPAHAFDGTGFDTGGGTQDSSDLTLTGTTSVQTLTVSDGYTTTLDGPVVVGESLGPELLTQTCAGWGLSSPVGAWSCSGDTITRTASGSSLTITNTAAVAGTTYKVVVTYATITAGTFAVSAGGVAQATHGTAGTYTEYITAGGTGAITITAVAASAGTITISTTSAKAVTSTLTSASGTLKIEKTAANATANETGLAVSLVQTGGAGDKTALGIDFIGSGSGSEYLITGKNSGTSTFSVTAAGAGSFSDTLAASGRITGSLTASGTSGVFGSSAALTNNANSVFTYLGKPAIHSAGTDLEGVRMIPDLSNNHTGGNWISYSAPDLVSPDPNIVKYAVKVGANYDYILESTYTRLNAMGAVSYKMTSDDDAAVQVGMIVEVDDDGDDRFKKTDEGDIMPIGVYSCTVQDCGATALNTAGYSVAQGGRVYVAPAASVASVTRGDMVYVTDDTSGSNEGYAEFTNSPGSVAIHNAEIGHALYSEAADTFDAAGDVDPAANTIANVSTAWAVGEPVIYWAAGDTPPTGMTSGNVYFILSNTTGTVTLSATKGGTVLDITADGSGVANYLMRLPLCLLHFN